MNATALFDYASAPKEQVMVCNLCGSSVFVTVANRDRYGYPQPADQCQNCGLVFLNPRMSREGYARFYESGYRPLLSAFRGQEINEKSIQPQQGLYAKGLARFLDMFPYFYERRARTLLDVGGSTGVVARRLAKQFGLIATVLDPAPKEIAEATGLEVVPDFVEDFDPGERRWDLITVCQTVDHLLDIAGAMRKLQSSLAKGGWLFVDIVDFARTRVIKLDHPYNLTEETMAAYLAGAGLRVVCRSAAPEYGRVSFLCRSGKA